jgi:hypothetical protein
MTGMIKHYLYKDIEVCSTGRFVNKPNHVVRKIEHFVEITPVDDEINWTKFVNIEELYLIQSMFDAPENKGELVLLNEKET